MLKTIAFAVFFTATSAVAQVADTPEEAQGRADFSKLPKNEQIVGVTSMLYVVRDARDLCGFKLTAFAEHMVEGADKFATVEQRSLAEILSNKTRPRAPLAEFCNGARDEFANAPAKWFAE